MAKHGCAIDGSLNEVSYSKPLPAIGIYITTASLIFMLLMSLDALHAFRYRKPWFPCKHFTLNSAFVTLLSIATKLPVDLNTPMPSLSDQLSKLTGTVLICTVLGNLMPSLGTTSGSEILSNIFALGILIITTAVNICIQMGTGVIYVFLPEHTIIIFFMFLLLLLVCFAALTVPTTKLILNDKFRSKLGASSGNFTTDNDSWVSLKRKVEEFWMMAHTSSPQYVLGRSAICDAVGALSLLSALVLAEAVVRSFLFPLFCNGKSDYGWSTWLVFVSQALTVAVGSVAPFLRWVNAINFRSKDSRFKDKFGVEGYWIERLVEWKRCPFPFYISNRHCRAIAYRLKSKTLSLVIETQRLVVQGSKFIRLVSNFLVTLVKKICCEGKEENIRENQRGEEENIRENQRLRDFVLCLDGEEDLVELISESGREDIEEWIAKGTKHRPDDLIRLLEKSTTGFNGVVEFESDDVPPISAVDSTKPPNCWALPIVTLTSIAVAIFNSDREGMKWLVKGVNQGLKFVNLIEKNLDCKGYVHMREAAGQLWAPVELYGRWLDIDLGKYHRQVRSWVQVLEELAKIGEKRVLERRGEIKGMPIEWPKEVLAGYAMYTQCRTILERGRYETKEELREWLERTIADMLRACMFNLPQAIYVECSCANLEEREGMVRNAAYILGEAHNFLGILGNHNIEGRIDHRDLPYVEGWRSSNMFTNP